MIKVWYDKAWEDYQYWVINDKKTVKRINQLITDIERNGVMGGIGKSEPLKYEFSGWFSKRIDDENRLIYRIKDNTIEIAQCKGHYYD